MTCPRRPQSAWIDNQFTWLTFTDLVVVDAIGTGYSRAAPGVAAAQFYEADGDALSFARFIHTYLAANHRERSPKFLAGESYGGTRAAVLAHLLPHQFGITLNGLILISPVLDFGTLNSEYGNPDRSSDLAFAVDVPTYAATAAYHKKLRPDLETDLPRLLREVEQWSTSEYLPALVRGDTLLRGRAGARGGHPVRIHRDFRRVHPRAPPAPAAPRFSARTARAISTSSSESWTAGSPPIRGAPRARTRRSRRSA